MELFNSRKTIFELLKHRGFDIDKYDNFSSTELDLLNENNQLDLNIKNKDDTKQVIIKYVNKKITKKIFLKTIFEEFNKIDNKSITSEIIFIINTNNPHDWDYEYINGLQNICNKYFDSSSKYSQIFHIKHLTINITKHESMPKYILMNSQEEKKMLDDYQITKDKLPCILRNDPMAKYYGLKINDIVKIIRNNNSIFYRRCK